MTQPPAPETTAPAAGSVLPRVLVAALVVAGLLAAGREAGAAIPRFAEWVAGLGPLGPVVFVAGYALAVAAFVPASLLTLAAGAVFGLAEGVALVFVAATLGASLAFVLARTVARGAVERRIAAHPGFAAVDRAVAANGRRIVFLLRLSPAFPFTFLNYALGLTRVRFADYLVASVGMLPGTILYVYYGKLAGDVAALAGGAAVERGAGYWAVLGLGLAATVAVTAVVTRTARRALAQATERKVTATTLLSARQAIERARSQGQDSPAASTHVYSRENLREELARIVGSPPPAGAPDSLVSDTSIRSAAAPGLSSAPAPGAAEATGPAAVGATTAADAPPTPGTAAPFVAPPGPGATAPSPMASRPVDPTPLDEHNRRLLEHVRPSSWSNPEPAPCYDLVVIGAGAAGLISAAVASGLGARVALVEKHLMGGDCLNTGCVPSKTLLRYARRLHEARDLPGLASPTAAMQDRWFGEALAEVRRVRAAIAADDAAARYRDELGVDVFLGEARFTSRTSVAVGGATLRFRKAIVASGARAALPPVPGLAEAGFLTNETVFDLAARPARLVVLGAGPIGCELAQAFARFGCKVTLIDRAERVLPREDAGAAAVVQAALEADGVRLLLGAEVRSVSHGHGGKVVAYHWKRGDNETVCDEVLVAAGRRPNVEGMDLEKAGVEAAPEGIRVDARLRTTNRRVYAAGDCALRWQFTHAADASAKIAVQNALFFGRRKASDLAVPWCTYTDPEVAHAGLGEEEARARGIEVDTYTVPLERVNRAVCDGDTAGFVKVLARKGSDRIVGATIVADHAGEMIGEVLVAMAAGAGLARIAQVIHPYPTEAEGIKAAANAYMRTRLTPKAKKFLAFLLRVQR